MDELEQRLKAMRLAAPPAEMDRHVDGIFSSARTRKQPRQAAFYWWLAATASVGGVAVLLLVAPRPSPPVPDAMVYHVEAQGRMREMLLNPSKNRDELPPFIVRITTP